MACLFIQNSDIEMIQRSILLQEISVRKNIPCLPVKNITLCPFEIFI